MTSRGGVQTRRSHTKSRTGCKTCKRRHIRCDEIPRQCNNCTKHNVRCDYMDLPTATGAPSTNTGGPNMGGSKFRLDTRVEEAFQQWRKTGIYPFPNLGIIKQSFPAGCSETELRLIHHISSVASEMQKSEENKCSVWVQRVPTFLKIALENDFVLQALLSLSADHLSWVTESEETLDLSYRYHEQAFKGLNEAMRKLSKENFDAILAASILLSWQASEWSAWASLMKGTSIVIEYMQEWKQESALVELIEEIEIFSELPEKRTVQGERLLHYIYKSLRKLEPYVADRKEETRGLNDLMHFVQYFLYNLNRTGEEDQFEVFHPLRNWLKFLPISFVKRVEENPDVMILLAHFYAVALAVEPLFPAIGPAWFGITAIGPILEIHKNMVLRARLQDASSVQNMRWPLSLMEFPLEMVRDFRLRMGWRPDEMSRVAGAEGYVGHKHFTWSIGSRWPRTSA